jgi:replicative DNA helicase
MTVGQQIILHMVTDNSVIRTYEGADILTYKFFTTDYNYLQFVQNRWASAGGVTLGELSIKFPEFPQDFAGVSRDSEFLIYQLKELYVYNQMYSAINEGQQRFPDDGIQLLGYLEDTLKELRKILPLKQEYDLIATARERYDKYLTRSNDPKAFIPTGFPELDNLIGGWSKSGELAAFVARMGMGKTWLLIYCCIAAWQAGFRCGFISIEMGADDIGYRMDTTISGLSNSALRRGDAVDMKEYQRYLDMVDKKEGIILRSKKDFGGHITPSAIANWIQQARLDVLFCDGFGYVENERRGTSNDVAQIDEKLEDLKSVSTDTGCPIVLTGQANRGGADKTQNPQLEHVRGGDSLGIHASFIVSIAYPEDTRQVLSLEVIKSRFEATGQKMNYHFDPNHGYIESRGEVTTTGAFFGGNNG